MIAAVALVAAGPRAAGIVLATIAIAISVVAAGGATDDRTDDSRSDGSSGDAVIAAMSIDKDTALATVAEAPYRKPA